MLGKERILGLRVLSVLYLPLLLAVKKRAKIALLASVTLREATASQVGKGGGVPPLSLSPEEIWSLLYTFRL